MRAYEINEFGIEKLSIAERKMPVPQANEVVVKFHAASLNYRDLMMVKGLYDPKLETPLVPFSDGAGEVVEVGSEVTRWQVGDRVMPTFMQGWIDGEIEYRKAKTALGGDLDGCLREFGAFRETGLVPIPGHLTYEEAATLPCAGVTAWNALKVSGRINKGDRVLLLGTGGVSIFALQFAKNIGAETIITSSSDEKLEMASTLGANHTINYKTNPDWDKEVLEITGKRGVDHVVEVGGAGTLQSSINCVRMGGHVAVIGVLSGKGEFDPITILMKAVRLQGIFVGSRAMFEEMAELIRDEYIKPVITTVYEFDDARDALTQMESGDHFGKIVVKIG
ncbi:MAG: NAD(P)-dependent alcohol dehydrogenase [Acidobacteriota bacterium]|nr:NAD(P)-dependent alcohol dehydrogenase [Acidobacteriota bacterium]MDH3530785.1 NAD(P)-dependent alcohol dehydrogenase [Acidobacteriota bacterium]